MTQTATVYRMKLPDHECPYGLAAKTMLEEAGYQVDDHLLTSRDEVEAYMNREGVDTTPQVFIDGQRIGGSEAVAAYLENADA